MSAKLEIPDNMPTDEVDPGPIVTLDEMVEAVNKLANAARSIGLSVDTGVGFGQADLWITINGERRIMEQCPILMT